MSWMNRYRTPIVIAAIGLSFVLLLGAMVFFLHRQIEQKQLQEQIKERYEQQIEQLKTIEQQAKTRILVAARNIPAGETLKAEDLQLAEVPHTLAPEGSFTELQAAVGKAAKIDLLPNMPLTASMLFEGQPLARDVRIQQFHVIQLPSDLRKGQFVDVRINFPTGEDFIVLAKKKIRDLSGTVLWTEMNEPEILRISSAIIDAYLQGAKLYALVYVDPGMQEAAIANYPSNPKVLDLMESDPNILVKAQTELARQLRATLDGNLKAMSDADKLRVVSGSVTVQQQLQNERLATQQSNAMQQLPAPQPETDGQTGPLQAETPPEPETEPPATSFEPGEPGNAPLPEATNEEPPTGTDKLDDIFNQPSGDGPAS